MNWLALHIDTSHPGLDPVTALLSARGIDGVSIEDEEDFRDFLENNRQYWDYVDEDLARQMAGRSRVTFYLPADGEGLAKMGEVRIALAQLKAERPDCDPLLLSLDTMESEDWENGWKQYYKSMKIGERLLIVPRWEAEGTDFAGRTPLFLDPGLAFGTGGHATTRLCLTALERLVRGGERVLDLGCGSGILSIAALRLGAASASAVDIDRMCLNVAYENAALNGIGRDTYTVKTGDILRDEALRESLGGGYDLVFANIVADVILGLAPLAHSFLREGGAFLCSGIIDSRAEETAQGLRQAGWEIAERREDSGWAAFICRQGEGIRSC